MSTDSHGYDAEPATRPVSSRRSGTARRAGARTQRARRGEAPPRRRRKARRVHRVIRHVDIWSLAKIGGIYVACGYVVSMISGFILWRAADIAGTIDGIEGFMEDTGGYDTFEMRGDVVFSSAVMIGAVLSLLAVCLIILAGILFNLISDLTGGIRMTVIDEDLLVTPARRGAPPRRPVPRVAPVDVYEDDDDPYDSGSEFDDDDTYDDHHDDDVVDDHDGDRSDTVTAAHAATPDVGRPAPVVVPPVAPQPASPTWDRPETRVSEPAAVWPGVHEPGPNDVGVDDAGAGGSAVDEFRAPEPRAPEPRVDETRVDEPRDTGSGVRGTPAPDEPSSQPSPAARPAPVVAPAPAPSFRPDSAATPSFSGRGDTGADPVDETPVGPSGSDEDPTADTVAPVRTPEPEPEPTGDVDPAFDRLLAGAGAGDVSAETDDDEPDPEPTQPRFEIDFG